MHPLKKQYYESHYIATVDFEDGEMKVKGGRRELRIAKSETNFCYVKDLGSGGEIKIVLQDGEWVREDNLVSPEPA